ncbi:MAG TPA: hypothetical protein DEP84_21485 [Chloroflexi bacterium]|nr:hypothetical protein [Chloroflexota bacterium]
MARAEVDAGACGYSAVITVRQISKDSVQVQIESACEMLTAMNEELAALKWRGKDHQVFRRIPESAIYRCASCHIRHTGCPVPGAIIKAIEVEVGAAVPRDVTIRISKDGENRI